MKEDKEIIEINTGNFFPIWMHSISFILFLGAFSIMVVHFYDYFLYYYTDTTFSESIIDFLCFKFPIMLLFVGAGIIFMFSKKLFEFNPNTKEIRNGVSFFKWKYGKWEPLIIENCSYISFQRYDESINYTFGGFHNKQVKEHIYDIRLVYTNKTFKSLYSACDFHAVAQMIILGRTIGDVYGVPFRDFVKDIIIKEQRNLLK